MSLRRKALGLPKKESAGGDELSDALARKSGRAAGGESEKISAPPDAANSGWAEEEEGSRAARWGLRAVVYGVLGLMAVLGIRSIVFPPRDTAPQQQTDPQEQAQKDDVPEAAAQQVAARFARSYLTWSHDNPKTRQDELAADLPKGADLGAGWNGSGSQAVAQTIAGPVTQTRPHQARVSVDVRVSSTTGTGKKARTVSAWRGLEVPVAESGGRILVTGQPALVGMREPVQWTAPDPGAGDADLALSTHDGVEDFFKAWVAGTADQASAPGATIAPLGSGMAFGSLDAWTVEKSSGSRRTGLAAVTWRLAGAELQQTYRVTVAQVSASGASRWQVWQVSAQ